MKITQTTQEHVLEDENGLKVSLVINFKTGKVDVSPFRSREGAKFTFLGSTAQMPKDIGNLIMQAGVFAEALLKSLPSEN